MMNLGVTHVSAGKTEVQPALGTTEGLSLARSLSLSLSVFLSLPACVCLSASFPQSSPFSVAGNMAATKAPYFLKEKLNFLP